VGRSKSRGTPPLPARGTLADPEPPADYSTGSPKFCLHHAHPDFDVAALDAKGAAAFARTLQRLARMSWGDLMLAPRHGIGTELVPAAIIKPSVPQRFRDRKKFMVFRYDGKLPMAGIRAGDVFHIIWIEPAFNKLYDHGS
jgi:hypothetical protein